MFITEWLSTYRPPPLFTVNDHFPHILTADRKFRKKIVFTWPLTMNSCLTSPWATLLSPWRTDSSPSILGKAADVPGSDDGLKKIPPRCAAPSCVRRWNCWKWVSNQHAAITQQYRAALRSDEITELSWPVELHGFYKMLSHRDTVPSYLWKWVCLCEWLTQYLNHPKSFTSDLLQDPNFTSDFFFFFLNLT